MPSTIDQQLTQRFRPDERPAMYQSWQELLFLHWRYEASLIQKKLPAGLTVDTYDGHAWVAVVPFFMRNIRPWWFPAVPSISNFLELNVRTYVQDENGVPGVWFFSLNANNQIAVEWAKRWYFLPYHYSSMKAKWNQKSGAVNYQCHRWGTKANQQSSFEYAPVGQTRNAKEGTLEFFLVERYLMFMIRRDGSLASGQVYHTPYEICDADVTEWDGNFLEIDGLPVGDRSPDHALISRRADVEVFKIRPCQ